MKKIIILFIYMAIISNTPVFGVTETKTNTESGLLSEAKGLLESLEIMSGYSDGTFREDSTITRAEFAIIVSRIINIEAQSAKEVKFTDIPRGHWAYETINALTDMGLLNGYSDGTFKPDNSIKLNEAYKTLLSLAGYDGYAKANGGFPIGYEITARSLKINVGLSGQPDITRADMAILVYNVLNIPVMKVTSYGSSYNTYDTDGSDTLLSLYKDIYSVTGRVTEVEGTSLTSVSSMKNNMIRIDDAVYKINNYDAYNFLGLVVKAYYYKNDSADVGEIVYMSVSDAKNDYIDINASDIASVSDDYELFYYPNPGSAVTAQVSVSKGASVIYNGIAIDSYNRDTFMIQNGKIRLINSKNLNYDIIIIEEYENFVTGDIDANQRIVYDKYGIREKLDLSEERGKVIKILAEDGTQLDFTAIIAGSVLTVYRSGNDFYKVYVSNKRIDGIVDSVSFSEDVPEIVMNGVTYQVDANYMSRSNDPNDTTGAIPVNPGEQKTFLLNVYEEIVCVGGPSSYRLAYFIAAASTKGLDQSWQIKVFDESSQMLVLNCENRLYVDGNRLSDGSDVSRFFTSLTPQLIRYQLSENGKVSGIDTATRHSNEDYNTLQVNIPFTSGVFRGFGLIEPKCLLSSNTIIFMVPADAALPTAQDWEFAVVGMKKLVPARNYNFESYRTSYEASTEQILLIKGDNFNRMKDDADVILVEKITNVVNENGIIVERLYGYSRGTPVHYDAKPGISFMGEGVEEGDIIRVGANMAGEVDTINIYYDYSTKKEPSWAPRLNAFDAIFRLSHGYAISKVDNILKLGYALGDSYDEVYNLASVIIMVYDQNRKEHERIYMGTINDITAYTDSTADYSRIVVQTKYSDPRVIIVYK